MQPPQDGQCEARSINKRPIDTGEDKQSKRPATVSQHSFTEDAPSFKTDGSNSNRKLIFLEFWAGSASLSPAMMKAGFHSMPVDFAGNKFAPKVQRSRLLTLICRRQLASSWLLRLWTMFNPLLSILDCLAAHAVGHVNYQYRKA